MFFSSTAIVDGEGVYPHFPSRRPVMERMLKQRPFWNEKEVIHIIHIEMWIMWITYAQQDFRDSNPIWVLDEETLLCYSNVAME